MGILVVLVIQVCIVAYVSSTANQTFQWKQPNIHPYKNRYDFDLKKHDSSPSPAVTSHISPTFEN